MTMTMKKTILLDTERSALSVQHLIDAGHVIRYKTPTFKEAADCLDALRNKALKGAPDYKDIACVTVDTITTLSARTRMDIVSDTESSTVDLWAKRSNLFAQRQDWQAMSDLLFRFILKLGSWSETHDIPAFILSHEGHRIDEATQEKKPGPDLNAMLLSLLMESMDYAWRVSKTEIQVKVGDKTYPPKTHLLRMAGSEKFMTKTRIPGRFAANIPDPLPNPSLPKAFHYLGQFRPTLAVIFGPWGSGKTTLGTSLSDPQAWDDLYQIHPEAKAKGVA